MSFIFSFFDFALAAVLLFDTLGLIYQFRKSNVDPKNYVRICFSWILFLTICTLFSCNCKGFFGTLIRLILLAAKVYVTIPKLNGTMKIHKYLIEDGNAEKKINQVIGLIKSKLCKCNQSSSIPSNSYPSETMEPERKEERGETIVDE